MNTQKLLKGIEGFVEDYFSQNQKAEMSYHNIEHTKYVVKASLQIGEHYQLKSQDMLVLISAAWFHDIGYFTNYKSHEVLGAAQAAEYLLAQNVDALIIEKVKDCIIATKMEQTPSGLLQEILCDADLFHLGRHGFIKKCELLRKEQAYIQNRNISKKEWIKETISLIEGHQYYTDYCRSLLQEGKEKNVSYLKAEFLGIELENNYKSTISATAADGKSKKSKDRPDKGIETMFRVSSSNHSRLSDMADHKAHILITVNSIILSAIISLVLRKLDNNSFLTIPSFILLTVCLVTIIFSILATRPSIPQGRFTQSEIEHKEVNLLFFGNFFRMSLKDYTEAMNKVMDDRDFLYDNLIRDVYFQGIVLGKKYRLLRIAYNIFMFGLSVSVIAFIVSSTIVSKHMHPGTAGLIQWRDLDQITSIFSEEPSILFQFVFSK